MNGVKVNYVDPAPAGFSLAPIVYCVVCVCTCFSTRNVCRSTNQPINRAADLSCSVFSSVTCLNSHFPAVRRLLRPCRLLQHPHLPLPPRHPPHLLLSRPP